MFNSDGSINPKYNSNKKTGIIAQIFEDHWNNFYKSNKHINLEILYFIISK